MPKWFAPRAVGVLYCLAALALTWPLGRALWRELPWDLGDSLLNCWILAWNSEHLLAAIRGDPGVLAGMWHGNMFHPAPYTLAYSELLLAQTLQGLPLYALTGNIVLVYNVLFLSTFVLSAFGMYLFVRELTGDTRAAFLAGLLYGFLPYRTAEGPHLQVLSSQWMPFALYGFRRFFTTSRTRPLVGATAAIIAQNLSCGYYLVYFAMFLPVYTTWELVQQGRWRHGRTWVGLGIACVAVAVCTVPFMLPYLELRELTGQQRSIEEVATFAPDVGAYATADANLWFWPRWLPAHPRPEGNLFPGAVLVCAALGGIVAASIRSWRSGSAQGRVLPRLGLALRRAATSTEACLALCAFTAFYLSLGPTPRWGVTLLRGVDVYPWLFAHVPGLDGLRVPARFAMIAFLFLTVLAGAGFAAFLRRLGRAAVWSTAIVTALILLESAASPMPLNTVTKFTALEPVPPRVATAWDVPVEYRVAARLPEGAVIVEFPLGDVGWDLWAVYHSTLHWKPLVNGFSGGFPKHYEELARLLFDVNAAPDRAWDALQAQGPTHAIVHRRAYHRNARNPERWLVNRGARQILVSTDVVAFELPGRGAAKPPREEELAPRGAQR